MAHVLAEDLRAAVLQAAIEGKLTEQLPEDGDAWHLLHLLKKAKEQLVKEKKVYSKKPTDPFYTNEELENYTIPENWCYAQLSDISTIQEGAGIRKWQYRESGTQILCVTNILEGDVDLEKKHLFISTEEYREKYSHLTVNIGDIVCACSGGSWGKSAIYNENNIVMLNTSTLRLRFFNDLADNHYLYLITKSEWFKKQLKEQLAGMQPNFGYAHYSRIMIPLPPLAEQKRIVERVEELMAKIDEYEKLEEQLTELKEQFPDDMKAALLQAAMEGKLIEQLPDDDEANVLRKELITQRKNAGKLPKMGASEDEPSIPDTWSYAKVGEVIGLFKGEKVTSVNLPYLEAKYLRGKSEAKYKTSGDFVKQGTTVILVDGENSGEVFVEPTDGILGSTFKVLYIPEKMNKQFALYYLEMNKRNLRENKKGAAIPHLNKDLFYNLYLPIPPLAEQKRIVEKLDQLLPLCDELAELET